MFIEGRQVFLEIYPDQQIRNFVTRIIAHRGYWDKSGAAQNSLAALNNAIELGV
jgi:glycerophosphoryl diester phosphodiesterase